MSEKSEDQQSVTDDVNVEYTTSEEQQSPNVKGVTENTYVKNYKGYLYDYGIALQHLKVGACVGRKGMVDKGQFIYKQIPQIVPFDVIPNMTSVPESVKKILFTRNQTLSFEDNLMIVDSEGRATYYAARGEDMLAKDWILM